MSRARDHSSNRQSRLQLKEKQKERLKLAGRGVFVGVHLPSASILVSGWDASHP